ncbi:MAG: DUF1592 domain-containing protein, partial [Myxococcales bacterium]|nr:DUF1592 domain-containing protein [Myxococcales bacterium]
GGDGGQGGAGGEGGAPMWAAPPAAKPLQRLSRVEYAHTLGDLLAADAPALIEALPPDVESLGFDNQAESQAVPTLLAERYLEVAEQLADEAVTRPEVVACEAPSAPEDCARAFLAAFLPRAFRRPITADELDRFVETYALGAAEGDHAAGLSFALVHALLAPPFLYRLEDEGAPVERGDGSVEVPVGAYGMANRLSYALWRTMPDDVLFAAAAADALHTPEQIRAQAERLLADPRAEAMWADFFAQWTGIDQLATVEKDAAMFPEFDAARAGLRAETEAFALDVVFGDDPRLATLLTADHAFASPETAALYDVDPPDAALTRVALDPTVRAGLLTQPAVLAVHAQSTRTSPVLRGHFIRESLLCGGVPEPPPGTNTSVPLIDPQNPNFDDDPFAETMINPECLGCHRLMNPLGWALEGFDAIGRYAPDRRGRPISTAGELYRSDVDGPFDGPRALAERLAGSAQVHACVATHWFRFAHGHAERPGDRPALEGLIDDFTASGGDLHQLLLDTTTADTFRLR